MRINDIIIKLKNNEVALRLREKKHQIVYKRHSKRMMQSMKRFIACNDKKSGIQIKREIELCKKYWHCYPLHYFRYDLYRKDKHLSDSALVNYIPEFFFYNMYLPYYDSRKFEILLSNKIITEQYFRSLNIAQPKTVCKLINSKIYTNELEEISFYGVEEKLKELSPKKIFVKQVDGLVGYRIYIFQKNDLGKYIDRDNKMFNESFIKEIIKNNDFIVQPGLEQDKKLSNIYSNSVNTFRICTENKSGNVKFICSTLRIGRYGNQVDNSAQDGIILKVDKDTGKVGDHATSEMNECFYVHPDTNFVFKDYKIKNWSEIKNFAIKSASKLYQFTYLGWDIALTEKGPVAIETNLGFGLDHYQVALGGVREIFGINDPSYYWRNIKHIKK